MGGGKLVKGMSKSCARWIDTSSCRIELQSSSQNTILPTRCAANLKREIAAVDANLINRYIENLPKELGQKCEETNLADDSEKRKVISKRGAKKRTK